MDPSTSNKRPGSSSGVTGAAKKIKSLGVRLKVDDNEMHKLKPAAIITMFEDVTVEQFAFVISSTVQTKIDPETAAAQMALGFLWKEKFDAWSTWLKGRSNSNNAKKRLRPSLPTLIAMIKALKQIRESAAEIKNSETLRWAAEYEAAFINFYITMYSGQPDWLDELLDLNQRLKDVVSTLEKCYADDDDDGDDKVPESSRRAVQEVNADVVQAPAESRPNLLTPGNTAQGLNIKDIPSIPPSTLPPTSSSASDLLRNPTGEQASREFVKSFEVSLDSLPAGRWESIQGLDELKDNLENDLYCLQRPEQYRFKEKPCAEGLLLHGPQGTGKTMLVEAFAKKFGLPLYKVGAEIKTGIVGGTESAIKWLFRELTARQPSILLLDEVEGLLGLTKRDDAQVIATQTVLKNHWGNLIADEANVFVFGTTNNPWRITLSDFSRRFPERALIGLPDEAARMQIFSQLQDVEHLKDADLKSLATMTEGYTATDIRRGVNRVKKELIKQFRKAKAWKKAVYDGEECLIPAILRGDAEPRSFEDLTPDQQKIARTVKIEAFMLFKMFSPDSPNRVMMTVSEKDVVKHRKWAEESRKK